MTHNLSLSNMKYSEETLEKYINSFSGWDWYYISYCQTLSEKFIEKHSDKLDWRDISWSQKLSEKFIEKHSNKIDWKQISQHQKLSEEFIRKHFDKIDIKFLMLNGNVSYKAKQEIKTLKEIIQ
jgi:hypothetical protein